MNRKFSLRNSSFLLGILLCATAVAAESKVETDPAKILDLIRQDCVKKAELAKSTHDYWQAQDLENQRSIQSGEIKALEKKLLFTVEVLKKKYAEQASLQLDGKNPEVPLFLALFTQLEKPAANSLENAKSLYEFIAPLMPSVIKRTNYDLMNLELAKLKALQDLHAKGTLSEKALQSAYQTYNSIALWLFSVNNPIFDMWAWSDALRAAAKENGMDWGAVNGGIEFEKFQVSYIVDDGKDQQRLNEHRTELTPKIVVDLDLKNGKVYPSTLEEVAEVNRKRIEKFGKMPMSEYETRFVKLYCKEI